MNLITFDAAFLPDSSNMTQAVTCTINADRISFFIPLVGNISGALTGIIVDDRQVNVMQSHEEVLRMLTPATA